MSDCVCVQNGCDACCGYGYGAGYGFGVGYDCGVGYGSCFCGGFRSGSSCLGIYSCYFYLLIYFDFCSCPSSLEDHQHQHHSTLALGPLSVPLRLVLELLE
mmetsp:Transcript_78092/g.137580  ORF Transcript_78092/g.137580 Transcript_78092/m.137580 type:complete len:101 (-) Transcript_78092:559-861(-)